MNDSKENTEAVKQETVAPLTGHDAIMKAADHFSGISANAEHIFIENFFEMLRNAGQLSAAEIRKFQIITEDSPIPTTCPGAWKNFGPEHLNILRSRFYKIEHALKIADQIEVVKAGTNAKKAILREMGFES